MENHKSIPADVRAMMDEGVRYALTGKADPETLRKIHAEADRIRKDVRRKHGLLDVGVPAIRELRDSE